MDKRTCYACGFVWSHHSSLTISNGIPYCPDHVPNSMAKLRENAEYDHALFHQNMATAHNLKNKKG